MTDRTVLIADDLKLHLQIERKVLEAAGFRVVAVESGDAALEEARKERPDLILLDLIMPGMDGAAACAAMRREPELAGTPIIIMSARGSSEARKRCFRAGCTEFAVKPEKPEELLGLVTRVLAAGHRKATHLAVVFSRADSPRGSQVVGRAVDMSGTGLLLVSSKPLDPGTVLDLAFLVPKCHDAVKARGQVARCLPNAEEAYEAGVRFVDLSRGDQESILDFVAT